MKKNINETNIIFFGSYLKIKNQKSAVIGAEIANKLSKHANVILTSSKKNIFLRMLDMIFSLLKNRKQISFIIIDTYSTLNFYYCLIISVLARFFQIPYYTHLHGGDLNDRLRKSPFFCDLIFKNSKNNISPSKFLFDSFSRKGYSTIYIPNFINIDLYKFKERRSCSLKLLWLRSFHAIYNPEMAIQVVKNLEKSYQNVELCMVGNDKDGSLKECKKLVDDFGLNKQIKFTGFLPKHEWISLSKNYDIFINTTNYDNMPVSIIEAMALGLPIVTTVVGGLKYLLDNNIDSLFVPKGDVSKMCKQIIRLKTNNDLCHRLSLNGRIKAEQFTWDVVKKDWYKLIKN